MPRYLDPASRLGEVLFGLIMVLSVTLTARLTVAEGPAGMHQLVLAALGCNLAWGIIDGVMYVMGAVTERAEKARIVAGVRDAGTDDAAYALIREKVVPQFETRADEQTGRVLEKALHAFLIAAKPIRVGVTADDLKGAIACFLLVFASSLPVVVLYLVMPDPRAAVRASNVLLLAMLFGAGALWGRFAGASAWWAGLSMVGIGLALVGVAVALGG
ncbi:MAG: VIT1/CCC1 transporter family protein [Alsobacter sp.]